MNSTNVVETVGATTELNVSVKNLHVGDTSSFQKVFDTGQYTTEMIRVFNVVEVQTFDNGVWTESVDVAWKSESGEPEFFVSHHVVDSSLNIERNI